MISRGDDLPAEEDRDAPRHLRRGALRDRAEVDRRDPEHGLQAVPRERGRRGEKDEGRSRPSATEGDRVRAPDERRALVAETRDCVDAPPPAAAEALGLGVRGPAALRARSSEAAAAGIRGAPRLRRPTTSRSRSRSRRRAARRRGSTRAGVARRDLLDRPHDRAAHAYGKAYRDVVRGFRGQLRPPAGPGRLPARRARGRGGARRGAPSAGAAAIPYGGGTSVVGGVEARGRRRLRGRGHDRPRRLDRVLEVDRASRAARIQAGATGPGARGPAARARR